MKKKEYKMKIGDKVWLFDWNRRVYDKNEKGLSGEPIYEKHFYEAEITGETSRSWIINGERYSKKTLLGIYTDEQKADKIWDHLHRYNIIEKVRQCSIEKLKQISMILNYKGDIQ